MDRIRSLIAPRVHYEPIENEADSVSVLEGDEANEGEAVLSSTFSWLEYSIFLLLGIAMLWAWCVYQLCIIYAASL